MTFLEVKQENRSRTKTFGHFKTTIHQTV